MATKHEQILDFIRHLQVGDKISVRAIAREIGVSEGTAYRAIKEAENQGLVSTIERVGTIRIEKKNREKMENLTFAEVVSIVDGQVLGGKDGLHKRLNKFVIGAMRLDDMMKYVEAGNLLIVGNRDEAHRLALLQGAAVLITGGFDAREETKKLADELNLPIISCSYDTFTVASTINRAIYDNLIKKEILLVEDILIPREEAVTMGIHNTVKELEHLSQASGHHHFPIIDDEGVVVGVITVKDVIGQDETTPLGKLISRPPITTRPQMTVASAAHLMIWEGIHLIPVIDGSKKLVGVLTRKDVLKALQIMQRQPQMGNTFDDLIFSQLTMEKMEGDVIFRGKVVPQMTNQYGSLSNGVLISMVTEASRQALREWKRGDYVLETASIYMLKPVQIDMDLMIRPRIIDIGRKAGKVDVEVYSQGKLAAKALLNAQVWEGP